MSLSENRRRAKELARERRGGAAPAPRPSSRVPLPARIAPCLDLGERLPGGCGSPLLKCQRHGDATVRFGTCPGAARSCETCGDYRAAVPEPLPPLTGTRHLLYHVYPRTGSRWRERVLRLRERIGLFTGKRLVAVATDGTTDPAEHVRDALHGTGCEIIAVPNDPTRREGATFLPLFERVAVAHEPGDALCYAHAKGVTRPPEATCHRWAEVMESVMWDYWPAVADLLATRPVAGPFKKVGRGWKSAESKSDWHYSGSYYWMRCGELFARDWRRIDPFWGGIEPYPSRHFTAAEAACLFHDGRVPAMNLYDAEYWQRTVEPAFAKFVTANAARRTTAHPAPVCRNLNFGCGPHRFPGWWNVDVVRTDSIKPDQVIPGGVPLPFADGAFDRAYLGHVLEHVPWPDVVPLLREIRRVLAPGGEVTVVGPDVRKAVLHAVAGGALERVWETYEDRNHYQRNEPEFDWPAARHWWNAYGARVAWALREAGFADVAERDLTVENFGLAYPVVDYSNPCQCAVRAVKGAE